jgi:hypothetical protein
MKRSYLVDTDVFHPVLHEIKELQKKADSITEDSTSLEIKEAYHNHGIAQGYIRCLRDLQLLLEPEYSMLFIRQLRIAEKIKELQEKSSLEPPFQVSIYKVG